MRDVIDTPTRRLLPARQQAIKAVILHTTGETDLDKILAFYTSSDGLQPHYMIEVGGSIRRIVAENCVAYHAKIDPSEARLYQQGYTTWSEWCWRNEQPVHLGSEYSGYAQWRRDWVSNGCQSPLDLITGGRPNACSIGIELQQPVYVGDDIFTDDQYLALADLVYDVCTRNSLAMDRQHLLGHYDVSPMRRSTASGSWDPGRDFSFLRLWDELRQVGA